MTKGWIGLLLVLIGTSVSAQTPAPVTSTSKFAWDYLDANLMTYAVTRFEIQYDATPWTSVGMGTVANDPQTGAGAKTYTVPFGALVPGTHTVSIRACNVDGCGPGTAPYSVKLVIMPVVPTNTRVVGG